VVGVIEEICVADRIGHGKLFDSMFLIVRVRPTEAKLPSSELEAGF